MRNIFRKLFKQRQLYILVLSYVVVILISIVINTLGNNIIINSFEKQVQKTNMLSMQRTKTIYDKQLSEIKSAAYNLLQSPAVSRLNMSSAIDIDTRAELLKMISRDISVYKGSNRLISECWLLIKNKNICVGSLGVTDIELAYEMSFQELYSSKDLWVADVLSTNLNQFVIKGDRNSKSLFLYQTLPGAVNGFEAGVVIGIKTNNDYYIENTDNNPNMNIYINSDNNIIFSDNASVLDFEFKDVKSYDQFSKGKYLISVDKSEEDGFYYVTSILNKDYRTQINNVVLVNVFTGFLCFLLCGSLAYFLSRKNYKPLGALIESVKEYGNIPEIKNEYQYIERIIKKALKDKSAAEKKLEKQGNYFLESFLRKLFLHKIEITDETLSSLANNNIDLSARAYAVVLIDMSDNDFVKSGEFAFTEENAIFAIKNVLDEVMGISAKVTYCEINDLCVFILGFNDFSIAPTQLKKKIEFVNSFLKEKLQLDFICAISKISEHIEDLPILYDMAQEVLEYSLLKKDNKVIDYSNISFDFTEVEFDYEKKRKLLNLIDTGNTDEVIKLINDTIDYMINVKKINIALFRILFSEIASVLLEAASKIPTDVSLDYKLLSISSLTGLSKIENCKKNICLFAKKLCEVNNGKEQKKRKELRIDKIKEYIELNYNDKDLTVSLLADEFGVTLYYISRQFKDYTGEGLSNYIMKYRINKAKEILNTTNDKIKKVADKVGFASSGVFIRVFKKFEGITPSEYRDK